MNANGRLTDLLHSEMGVLRFQFLVHSVSKDDPAIHWARRLPHSSGHVVGVSGSLLGCLWLSTSASRKRLEVKLGILACWHLNESSIAIAAI